MSKFTKKAIIDSFMRLLNTTAFDKITVKDIVDDCGVNRNTFYYYFKDIYALVDEVLQAEINKIIEEYQEYNSWEEGFLQAVDFALQNKKAIYHLHNSVKREQLEKYLHKVVFDVMLKFVRKEAVGADIAEEDIVFIAEFYECALVGLINKWLESKMEADPKILTDKIDVLFNGNIRYAVAHISDIDAVK